MDSTPPDSARQAGPRSLLIERQFSLEHWINTCPHAQTLSGYSIELGTSVFIPLPCKTWSCRWCAQTKIRNLAYRTRDAKPNRMMTLTVDPAYWDDADLAYHGTRRQVPVLIRQLRPKFGDIQYFRVTEVTKNGWPHYHLLIRSGFLPHAVVRDRWQLLTGASIVDLRQVKKSFHAYNYLVKYLAKLHKLPWSDRHLSWSRKFFPPEEPPKGPDLQLEHIAVEHRNFVHYILSDHEGETIYHHGGSVYTIEPGNAGHF